ncbi:invasion associated locus B family protein [Roseicella aerolata]|uniref:Invasion associated locus B family protein n=1 Tax=Roseicella aerolata TaxID=2883479 RepID=A0A9X1L7B5_9PROT|nr:invasion associated locus B family protein [Roseicella aerolata]MCB4821334.1 invasion associated locus B family protein [Roseicella aerolata]
MRMQSRLTLLAALLLAPALAAAQQPRPQKLGEYQSWTAASFTEGGQKTCYAFARPSKSDGNRQGVLLTVTHRPSARDTVTISAGYAFPRGAEPAVNVGGTDLPFYTSGSIAAARDGAAAVRAFRGGREAVMKAPGANGRGTVSDTFPLAGFSAAYDAISKECPTGGGGRR